MKLYELSEQYLRLMDEADSIPEDALADTLESLDGEFDEKADNLACVIKDWLGDKAKIDVEIDRLTERSKHLERLASGAKAYLLTNMQAAHKVKIVTPRVQIAIRKNPEGVDKSDPKWEEKFIDWAQTHNRDDLIKYGKPEPVIAAIKQAIEDGEVIPVKFVRTERVDIK